MRLRRWSLAAAVAAARRRRRRPFRIHRARGRCRERAAAGDQGRPDAKLDALQKDTHRQLVVATIPDLQGYPLEDYGYKLGRAWGVGLKDVE